MTREQEQQARLESDALYEARLILEGADIPLRVDHLRAFASCIAAQEKVNEELRNAVRTGAALVMA